MKTKSNKLDFLRNNMPILSEEYFYLEEDWFYSYEDDDENHDLKSRVDSLVENLESVREMRRDYEDSFID